MDLAPLGYRKGPWKDDRKNRIKGGETLAPKEKNEKSALM